MEQTSKTKRPATAATHYKRLRALALTAFICTVALLLFLWIESLIPGAQSAKQTDAVADSIQDAFDIDTTETNDDAQLTLSQFRLLIRKAIGHFSLFAILGFGMFFTFIMLIKPRWLAPILTMIGGFIAAGISEMFQLPAFTTGRYASLTDVGIDVLGVFTGLVVAAVIIGCFALIASKTNRPYYDLLKTSVAPLTFKTAFKKAVPEVISDNII